MKVRRIFITFIPKISNNPISITMKSFFFRLLPFICSLLISTAIFASEQTVQSVGMGASYDEARTKAIRYALENVFGTFISSQTEIRNDILQKDETYGISFGHIKK